MEILRLEINAALPVDYKISVPNAARARQLGFSEQVIMHMLLDRLEMQLSSLDTTVNGILVREWEASPIASHLFKTVPALEPFKKPHDAVQREARKVLVNQMTG